MRNVFLFLMLLAGSAWAQFPAQITVQEALPYSSGYAAGVSRTNSPVSFGFPLADSDAVADPGGAVNKMGLSGATVGQFRCIAWYVSGNCSVVQVDTLLPSYTTTSGNAGSTALSVNLSGSGNFGGSNLATDNGDGTITVATGAATFVIQKANFDFLHSVTVGSKTLVSGSGDFVIVGPDTTSNSGVPLAAPLSAPAPVNTGGASTYSATPTIYARTACVGPAGESIGSAASGALALTANTLLRVPSPTATDCPAPAYGYRVFIGTGVNATYLQNLAAPIPLGTDWIEPSSCPYTNAGADCMSGRGIAKFARRPIVWAGSSTGCGKPSDCTTEYKASLDSTSTAQIEENGPVKAVIKATGSFAKTATACPTSESVATTGTGANPSTNCYMRYTLRLYFYKNEKFIKAVPVLRNADYAPGDNSAHYESDFKAFSSAEIRLPITGLASGAKTYTFATPSGNVTGALDGTNDAFLYQGYSSNYQYAENAQNLYSQQDGKTQHDRLFAWPDGSKSPPAGYAQDGYQIKVNGAVCGGTGCTGTRTAVLPGWADYSDSSGAGVQMGMAYLSMQWPKALRFKQTANNTYTVVMDLFPNQDLWTGCANVTPCGMPYYQEWPGYHIFDSGGNGGVFFQFHDAALSDPASDFKAYQYPLLARASSVDTYNRAQSADKSQGMIQWYYPLLDPTQADTWKTAQGLTPVTVAQERNFQYKRWVGFSQGGEGSANSDSNQMESTYGLLRLFWRRGWTGAYLFALSNYLYIEKVSMHADGFTWRAKCVIQANVGCSDLGKEGSPEVPNNNGKYAAGNYYMATRQLHVDEEHPWFWAMFELYYQSGDENLHDFLNNMWAEYTLNPNTNGLYLTNNNASLSADRAIGGKLLHQAAAHRFFLSQKDTADAAQALAVAAIVVKKHSTLNLQISGYGTVTPVNAIGQISPVRGIETGPTSYGEQSDGNLCPPPSGGCGNKKMQQNWRGMYPEGLAAVGYEFGPAGTDSNCTGNCYWQMLDTASGLVQGNNHESWIGPANTYTCLRGSNDAGYCTGLSDVTTCTGGGICVLKKPGLLYNYLEHYESDKFWYRRDNSVQDALYQNWAVPATMWGYMPATYQSEATQYLQNRGIQAETDSYIEEALVNAIINPPAAHWVDVPVTKGTCTASGCALTWTPPDSVTAYRLKAKNDGRTVVTDLNLLGFDNVTDPGVDGSGCTGRGLYLGGTVGSDRSGCFTKDPRYNWPFFSSDNATAPAVGLSAYTVGPTQYPAVSGVTTGFNTVTPSQNNFALEALVGGTYTPPAEGTTGSTLRGGTLKGGVIR